ncbi:MAG TPA: hypothetical protein VHQ00_12735, partial [Chloroflexota bacterium]|nr:hypothetical protein [Chloroflexota bacterium]
MDGGEPDPVLAAVVVSYNVAPLLARCLESLRRAGEELQSLGLQLLSGTAERLQATRQEGGHVVADDDRRQYRLRLAAVHAPRRMR